MKELTGIYWIKNEARYLPEYIEFHLLQGFDHFIFYDNASDDKTLEVLQPYMDEHLVEVRTYPPGIDRKNFWLMSQCIDEQKGKSKWIHFHAIDERLFSPTGAKVTEMLSYYDKPNIGGVSVNWQQLHSNGEEKRKDGLIIENFTVGQNEDPHHHVKTIIRPERTLSNTPQNPHNFHFMIDNHAVDENFNIVVDAYNYNPYTMEIFKNIHYATMSREEFETKYNKGVLDNPGAENIRREAFDSDWNYYHGHGNKDCQDLLMYVEPVKSAIQKRFKNKPDLLEYINH